MKQRIDNIPVVSASSSSGSEGTKKATRLMKELKKLKESKDLSFSFDLQDDNIRRWKVTLPIDQFDDKNSLLVQDMIKYKISEIEMEILFPEEYPFLPPFVRVVSPRFKLQTGHITIGGSLCMMALVPGHWSPACSLEALIIEIKMLLIEGGGQLHPQLYNKSYSLLEAEEAFKRVAKGHGWM